MAQFLKGGLDDIFPTASIAFRSGTTRPRHVCKHWRATQTMCQPSCSTLSFPSSSRAQRMAASRSGMRRHTGACPHRNAHLNLQAVLDRHCMHCHQRWIIALCSPRMARPVRSWVLEGLLERQPGVATEVDLADRLCPPVSHGSIPISYSHQQMGLGPASTSCLFVSPCQEAVLRYPVPGASACNVIRVRTFRSPYALVKHQGNLVSATI